MTSENHSTDKYIWGPRLLEDGQVRFRIWAPAMKQMALQIEAVSRYWPMNPLLGGWFQVTLSDIAPGTRYRFVLPDGQTVPDPASHFQPADVHGPSELIDTGAYRWSDQGWRGRPWHEATIYELHVGSFSSAGTFRGAMEKLPHLLELGVTAIELMPIADFPGRRNWGYDGVFPYAPDASYGRPEDLQALIDAAHRAGLMVLLDVVYNHFGPEGNYLHSYACPFFTDRHKTPWGPAINFDGADSPAVRAFFIQNARYWLEQFHFDGLRLDAVHAIVDESDRHVLDELAYEVRERISARQAHLILENEENAVGWLERNKGKVSKYTAQWNDDVHHVLHTVATGEGHAYYQDYLDDTVKLGRALAEGFAFQGEEMRYRGRARGMPCSHLPPECFVAFIQNHDQIGNRAFGERLGQLAPARAVQALAAVYLLLPQVPMLFMGEEWASRQPFPFFCDFQGELAQAVRNGRREEFARFPEFHDPAMRDRIPDPLADATFRAAKLDWNALKNETESATLQWYRRILAVRTAEIVPCIPEIRGCGAYEVLGPGAVEVTWRTRSDRQLRLRANLSANAQSTINLDGESRIWTEGVDRDSTELPPWSVIWSVGPR